MKRYEQSILNMRLIVNWFFSYLIMWCLKIEHITPKMANTTDGKTIENIYSPSTDLKETPEKTSSANSDIFDDNVVNFKKSPFTFDKNKSAEIENVLNVTSTSIGSSTDEDKNDANDSESSFNLALIPATAVFVLVIVICFKCCKWFRKYTKGDDKDVKYYAVVLENDDFGHVDIETISSNTSLLRSHENENILTTSRNPRKGKNNNLVSLAKIAEKQTVNYDENNPNNFELNNELSKRTPVSDDRNKLVCNPARSPITGNEKLSVSFSGRSELLEFQLRDYERFTKQPNNVRCSVRKSTADKFENLSTKNSHEKPLQVTLMNDVGTQTNKSFRTSLLSLKGHMSESDMNKEDKYRLSVSSPLVDVQKRQTKGISDNNTGKIACGIEPDLHAKISDLNKVSETNICKSKREENLKHLIMTHNRLNENTIDSKPVETDIDSDMADDVFDNEKEQGLASKQNTENNGLTSKHSFKTCINGKTERDNRMVHKSFAQIHCNKCNANERQDFKEHICDTENEACFPNDIPTLREMCNKCNVLDEKEKVDLCKTVNSMTGERTVTSQCHRNKVNDRPDSSSSLESSGYAELSSSECSSSSH